MSKFYVRRDDYEIFTHNGDGTYTSEKMKLDYPGHLNNRFDEPLLIQCGFLVAWGKEDYEYWKKLNEQHRYPHSSGH